jgi:ABC-type transport system involved in multi-copper enzyme maturation permease subunit
MNFLWPLIKKEFQEDFMAARSSFFLVIATLVLSVFSVLLVSNTELNLLDNAEAVYIMACIIIALAALVAVIRGSDGFAGERERETLELLLLAPMNGHHVAFAKLLGILFSWLILYLLAIPYLWAVGSTGQNLLPTLQYLFITGTFIVLIFGSMALTLSAHMQTSKGALSINMTILLLLGSPVVLGPSLRQSIVGRMLDLVNPLAGALNTLDSVIIDSQGLAFQLLSLAIMILYFLVALWFLRSATIRIDL